ncbi:MAG: tyrosine-type recombinase/integrase [Bacteroidales bacterium]|nr:tyrosine-type recombinase/integrase [Bacteroidales bacterium]MCB9013946.1 tyrosine-type recombinase/integrase [Bacteroidales bacterium]
MGIIKTQRILYNNESRIRLIAEEGQSNFDAIAGRLPGSMWSRHLHSWILPVFPNHVAYFNCVFPREFRFYDISRNYHDLKVDEILQDKKILIRTNYKNQRIFIRSGHLPEVIKIASAQGIHAKRKSDSNCRLNIPLEHYDPFISELRKNNFSIQMEITVNHHFRNEEKFKSWLRKKAYSERSIKQYAYNVKKYIAFRKSEMTISNQDISNFLNEVQMRKSYSRTYYTQLISSLKAYRKFITGPSMENLEIKKPVKENSLPVVLSRKEIEQVSRSIANIKHRTLLKTMFYSGISVSETIRLQVKDILPQTHEIFISGGKYKADRRIPVPAELINQIEEYITCFNPLNYLFEGRKGKNYSERSIQKVVKKYFSKSSQTNQVSPRTLRHSFASHMVSGGMKEDELQKYLGFRSRRSCEVYRKISGQPESS